VCFVLLYMFLTKYVSTGLTCFCLLIAGAGGYCCAWLRWMTHTHAVGILWTSDRRVAELYTCTTHNIHKGQTHTPPFGFKPSIPASETPQFYASDLAATGISRNIFDCRKYIVIYIRVACRKASRSSRKFPLLFSKLHQALKYPVYEVKSIH
jgi:hypothetical protein